MPSQWMQTKEVWNITEEHTIWSTEDKQYIEKEVHKETEQQRLGITLEKLRIKSLRRS